MTEPSPTPEPKPPGSLVRDVAVLVLVGIALGVAHNAYLLGSGPRAGLSWIKAERALVKLEDVLPADPDLATSGPGAMSQPAAGAPAGSAASAGATSGRPAHEIPPSAPAKTAAPPPAGGAPDPSPSAATPPASAPATTPAATVAAPPADVPVIPVTREPLEAGLAVIRKLHAANAAVFVDARTANEYAEGHIPGAVHLSFDDVFKNSDLAKSFDDRGLPIVAYCGGGDCDLSRNLAFSLIDAGKQRVLVFLDGTTGWTAAGLPVTKGPQP